MTLTLDATLQTAQDGLDHHPICKIISKTAKGTDLPFEGNYFNSDTMDEYEPDLGLHSTGRLVSTYRKGDDLYLVYSDTDRTTWTEQLIYTGTGAGNNVKCSALVELSSGNLGVIIVCTEGTTNYLKKMIVSPTGTVVSAAADIATYATGTSWGYYPALCAISTGYLLVYRKYTVAGPVYELYKRTCDADFANWTAESALSISGISSTYDVSRPALIAVNSGRIYLFFDYVDDWTTATQYVTNVYSSYSTDDGATWSAAVKITNYTAQGSGGIYPTVAEKTTFDIKLAFVEVAAVLFVRKTTTGYCGAADVEMQEMHFDDSSGKLFVLWGQLGAGYKNVNCVTVIDTATWTIEKCYNSSSSSPKFSAIFNDTTCGYYNDVTLPGGEVVAFSTQYGYHVCYIDHSTETITHYNFATNSVYGLTKNVQWNSPWSYPYDVAIQATVCDPINDRLWVCFYNRYIVYTYAEIGYIDLTEQPDPITGFYSWHQVLTISTKSNTGLIVFAPLTGGFVVDPDEGVIIVAGYNGAVGSYPNEYGHCRVYHYSTGSLLKHYTEPENTGFPYYGLQHPCVCDGKIYGTLVYTTNHDQAERRGLVIIDMANDTVRYSRPTWATKNDYGIKDIQAIDADTGVPRLIMATDDGPAIFDIDSETWTLFDSDAVPGLEQEAAWYVDYDEANDTIYTGYDRIQAFKESGDFRQVKIYDGALQGDDSYVFSNLLQMTTYSQATAPAIATDENDVVWALWDYIDSAGENSLMWDRTAFSPEVQGYILAGAPVKIEWELHKSAKAGFSLARGDLFDPTNLSSIYAPVLKKGRLVEIYFGEAVAGQNYWQMQGEFMVVGSGLTYSQGHPRITVSCEDQSTWWDEHVITATPGYRGTAISEILVDLLEDALGYDSDDYVVPTWDNLHTLYAQWVDDTIENIFRDIETHFGAFRHWGVDGKFRMKLIDLESAADHVYSDLTKIHGYSPEDKYSSFINAVIVKCQGIEPMEVLWDEERIEALSGTLGWWSKEETITVWYSSDRTRRCRYPRLNVIASINDYSPLIKMLGGNGSEAITYEDPDETYCIITIEAPDRSVYVLAFAAAVLALGYGATGCDYHHRCGVSIMLTNMALTGLVETLSAVASYRYDLWAWPLGHEFESYQGRWDDDAFQAQLGGRIIPYEFEDPLSYTVQHCNMVAESEGAVIEAQRNCVSYEKTAHLQDELGDRISILHPVSGQTVKTFVARLVRMFVSPGSSGAGGKFTDSITGWKI